MADNWSLDKEFLEKRLKELADTPYSGERNIGAMCYRPVIYTARYKCDICGKTTEHSNLKIADIN
jgi:hypothetical protein